MPNDRPPIFDFNQQRDGLVKKTVARVVESTGDKLHVLNDAAYHETRRLFRAKRPKDVARLADWRHLARRLGSMSEADRTTKLGELATGYANDIAGNFNPRVYDLSARAIPTILAGLLSPRKLLRTLREPSRLLSLDALGDKVVIEGDTQRLRALATKGTLVFVPTHSSNLDSMVFGFALVRSGLPPATYGAGKNLFTNPLLSFFMHNLGAYKVDRRLRHRLYKDSLKAYSCILIENGFHSLFFPGGTRSRSGRVEQTLKLGLMGTGVQAYTRTLLEGRQHKVFFVPATINYLVTLEAETLIEDFLSEEGKDRYIITDDESTRPGRVARFFRKLLTMNDAVVVRFGEPLDPFGSLVDADGISHDRRGRPVETRGYVCDLNGEVCLNNNRDAQYTRELGVEIARSFRRETVLMATHIVAAACFEYLRQQSESSDLYAVLRITDQVIARDELARSVKLMVEQLMDHEQGGEIRLADSIKNCSGGDIVSQATRAFRGYHTIPPLEPRADGIAIVEPKLLFFYQNRLAGSGVGWHPSARRRPS